MSSFKKNNDKIENTTTSPDVDHEVEDSNSIKDESEKIQESDLPKCNFILGEKSHRKGEECGRVCLKGREQCKYHYREPKPVKNGGTCEYESKGGVKCQNKCSEEDDTLCSMHKFQENQREENKLKRESEKKTPKSSPKKSPKSSPSRSVSRSRASSRASSPAPMKRGREYAKNSPKRSQTPGRGKRDQTPGRSRNASPARGRSVSRASSPARKPVQRMRFTNAFSVKSPKTKKRSHFMFKKEILCSNGFSCMIAGLAESHNGYETAEYIGQVYPKVLENNISNLRRNQFDEPSIRQVLSLVNSKIDETLQTLDIANGSGSSLSVVLITMSKIYVSNVGNSRVKILGENKVFETTDHVPGSPEESSRIKNVGGFVKKEGMTSKVALRRNASKNDYLYVSRGFGDFTFKNAGIIIVEPDIYALRKSDYDIIMIGSSSFFMYTTETNFNEFEKDGLFEQVNSVVEGAYEECHQSVSLSTIIV